ncbi:MAG: phage late control D family protein [Candidatus Binataceae bacterium]
MAASANYPVKSPQWILTYAGTNITADISAMVLAITYTDCLDGAAGEIEVALEDSQRRWQGPWYPTQADQISLSIGYSGEQLLPCGDFQVDQLELAGPPDVFHLRCVAAYITPAMRTLNSAAYENQTLPQIASTLARKHGLSVVGAPSTLDVGFGRLTQWHETDLSFLHRLAREHGYDFTVRGRDLVFYARTALESRAPVLAIERSDVIGFSFTHKTHMTYRAAQVSYQEPATKQLITQTMAASPLPATGDTLKLTRRCENGQQALLKTEAALHAANMLQITANIVLGGTTALAAGNNVSVRGFGHGDGNYLIETARHRLSQRGGALPPGYATEIEARRLTAITT